MDVESTLSNDPLDVDHLPRLDEADYVALEPDYLRSRLAMRGLSLAIVAVITMVVTFIASAYRPLIVSIGLAAALVVGVAALLAVFETKRIGYLIREHDVSYRDGIITRSAVSVPFNRVQNVSVERSGVERLFGLSSLTIRTAGGLLGSVTIPGLAPERAESLKEAILERATLEQR